MASVNDKFSATILTEHDGVQMSNTTYWEIDALGDDVNVSIQMARFLQDYYDSIKAIASDQWKAVCVVYRNLTLSEGVHVVFATLPGLALNTGHPQFSVFRVNRYAQNLAANAIKRGAFNQGGIEEAQSVRGRVTSPAAFVGLLTFLGTISILGGVGWTIQPLLRWNTTTPPAVPVYEFPVIRKQQMSTVVHTLRSRKTALCATG